MITAATALGLLVADWWDHAYNHDAYTRAIDAMIVTLRHSLGI
ncbi:MAG: hypothetical protein ACLP1D_12150 [Xanthobacteraceae bacterium]